MVIRVIKRVYGEPRYIIWAVALAILLVGLLVWVPNIKLIGAVLQGGLSLGAKLSFILGLYLALPFTYGNTQAIYTIVIAILFGLNTSMILYYISQNKGAFAHKSMWAQVGAFMVAVLGLGCASCGALLLTPLLGTALAGTLLLLPFDGMELSVISIAIILWSMYAVAKKIDNPYGM